MSSPHVGVVVVVEATHVTLPGDDNDEDEDEVDDEEEEEEEDGEASCAAGAGVFGVSGDEDGVGDCSDKDRLMPAGDPACSRLEGTWT